MLRNSFKWLLNRSFQTMTPVPARPFIRVPLRKFADYPSHELLGMPLLSPTMASGTIVKWIKKEGDLVKPGEVMFEVETDKATLGYEVQDEVVLAKILEQEGAADLPLGHPIAVLVEDEEDVGAFKDF